MGQRVNNQDSVILELKVKIRKLEGEPNQPSSDPAPILGDDDPSSDPAPTHGDAPHVDGHYMKRKRVYGTSPSKRLPMVEEQNNLMVLYECDLHPSQNFRETIDFSYLSLHIKQSGSHGSDSQPSNKQDAPDKNKESLVPNGNARQGGKMPLHTITRKYSPNIMTTKD